MCYNRGHYVQNITRQKCGCQPNYDPSTDRSAMIFLSLLIGLYPFFLAILVYGPTVAFGYFVDLFKNVLPIVIVVWCIALLFYCLSVWKHQMDIGNCNNIGSNVGSNIGSFRKMRRHCEDDSKFNILKENERDCGCVSSGSLIGWSVLIIPLAILVSLLILTMVYDQRTIYCFIINYVWPYICNWPVAIISGWMFTMWVFKLTNHDN